MTDYKNELNPLLAKLKADSFKAGYDNCRGYSSTSPSYIPTLEAIEALLSQHSKKRELELYNLYGSPRCENLHHSKKHQHRAFQDCPVEKIITDRISKLTNGEGDKNE